MLSCAGLYRMTVANRARCSAKWFRVHLFFGGGWVWQLRLIKLVHTQESGGDSLRGNIKCFCCVVPPLNICALFLGWAHEDLLHFTHADMHEHA